MAGRIPKSFIDELIARADIVELIGTRVPLKKAGREYKACCPFHDEKTPSFWVSPDKQFYHCFGCGAHGTALGFLMEYDRLPFPEAVEDLAARVGLPVPREAGVGPSEESGDLYALLERVTQQFAAALQATPRARDYARQRGLEADTIERFRIGYAPDSWDEVLKRCGASAADRQALSATGLIIERENASGHYDRFRDRLMFPIRDTRGRVIAFGGRVLDRGEPKYLNSPETVLFHKGRELYGLYEARQARTAFKRLLLVEGYMDAVQLHQAGLRYAVATLGTATTPEHLHRIFRLVSEVVFAFDGDRAGRAAAWRALQHVLPEARAGREIRFLFLPEGEDPDSLVRREGSAAFEQRIDTALPLSEYLVAQLTAQVELAHADGKAHFVALAAPLLQRVPPGVYRELLLERVAAAIGWRGERLQSLLGPEPREERELTPPSAPRRIGRGGLVTQAIQLLLHFPAAASAVEAGQRAALETLEQPGIAVLRELLQGQQQEPAASMAQTLERWRERPEYRRLLELGGEECLVVNASAAERELREAVARLIDEGAHGRLESLISRARERPLSDAEKLELQTLTTNRGPDRSLRTS